jgi:hypothetical protein
MTSRRDIVDGSKAESQNYGLVYTRKCGWIDLGHANPTSAAQLWRNISATQLACHPTGYSKISYSQRMSKFGLSARANQSFEVKDSLSVAQRKSVALAIFLDISNKFETMQSNWFYSLFTNSGYSAEDIVSNIVGFYRAVEPGKKYISLCEPVSLDIALKIWDKFGPVGANKNFSGGPFLYSINERTNTGSAMCGKMPFFLDTISPAKKGFLYRDASQKTR